MERSGTQVSDQKLKLACEAGGSRRISDYLLHPCRHHGSISNKALAHSAAQYPSSPAILGLTPQALCRRPLRRGLVSDLEHKPQAILYLAAVVGHEFRSDLAEVRAGEINRRISELNAIENIVRFNSGFQLEAFRQAK